MESVLAYFGLVASATAPMETMVSLELPALVCTGALCMLLMRRYTGKRALRRRLQSSVPMALRPIAAGRHTAEPAHSQAA